MKHPKEALLSTEAYEQAIRISVVPDGPYGHSLFRRLLASYVSKNTLEVAGIACVVEELPQTEAPTEVPQRLSATLYPRYVARPVDAQRPPPAAEPKPVAIPPQPATTSISRPTYGWRRSSKAAARRTARRQLQKAQYALLVAEGTGQTPSPRTYYDRLGWLPVRQFAIAFAALDDDERTLLDALIFGATDQAAAATIGIDGEDVPTWRDNILAALGVPTLALVALMVGLLDERKP